MTRLAHGVVGSPRISGDGKTVVWNQVIGDNLELMRYRDGKIDQVTHNPHQDMHASLSYDGSVMAWTRFSTRDTSDPSGHWDIVMLKDGKETVVADPRANQMDANVSRDGKVVAWNSDVDGKGARYKVCRHEAGRTQDITPGDGYNLFPQLSGDGSRLFWRSFDETGSDLYLRDQDGVIKPLTEDPEPEIKPAITPDGKHIVYGKGNDLYRLDLERSTTTAVANHKEMDEKWPGVSADGQHIVWTNVDRRKDEVDTQLWVQDNGGENHFLTQKPGLNGFPQVSDDGHKVAWLWVAPNGSDEAIYLVERDAGPVVERQLDVEDHRTP